MNQRGGEDDVKGFADPDTVVRSNRDQPPERTNCLQWKVLSNVILVSTNELYPYFGDRNRILIVHIPEIDLCEDAVR